MAWTVRVLGMPERTDWSVSELPAAPEAQDAAVRRRFPAWRLVRVSARGTRLTYLARPAAGHPPGHDDGTPVACTSPAGPELSLLTADGPDAGRVVPVLSAGITVGRGHSRLLLDDPAAPSSPTRVGLEASGLSLSEAGSPQPRFWDGRSAVSVGTTRLGVLRGRQPPLPPPTTPPPPVVELGSAPAESSLILPVAMAVGPLVIGVVLASTTGQTLFLLFGLMSLLGVGIMLFLQRRTRRRHITLLRERAEALAARRSAHAVTPAHISRAIRSGAADRFGLRAAPEAAAMTLYWGHGAGALPLSRDDAAPHWQQAVHVAQPAFTCPAAARPTAVTGPVHTVQATARWTLFQLLRQAVARGDSLTVHGAGRTDVWWQGSTGGSIVRLVLTDSASAAGHWAHAAFAAWSAAAGLRTTASVAPSTTVGEPVTVLIGAPGMEAPPPGDADLVDLTRGRVSTPAGPAVLEDVVFSGIAPATLQWWLEELGDDVAHLGLLPGGTSAPPLRVPSAVGQRTAARHVVTPLTAPRPGETDGSPPGDGTGGLHLDVADDGPHVLIAGTTGSGKSDLLLSVLVGLASHHPPAELALILLDFKGGASFGPLAALPHTMSLETNHVGAASLRTLDAIAAELRRREMLFAAAGVPDYPTYRRRVQTKLLPRLVVAVDELRVLVDEHPSANAVLQRLAATGRSLGFHLLLATQRATGAVSSDVRSNLGATLALRTASEQESWDLIGAPDAARIDPDRPGTAILTRGGQPPVHFRAASWSAGTADPVWRRIDEPATKPGPEPRTGADPRPIADDVPEATDWAAVVAQVARGYDEKEWPLPEPVVSPALPPRWAPERARRRDADALALLDDAARARHVTWRWPAGAAGSTAWIIERAGGREPALETVLEAAGRTDADVVVLDGTGEAGAPASRIGLRVLRPGEGAGTPGESAERPGESAEPTGADVLAAIQALAEHGGTVVVTGWPAWSALRVGESYRTLEEELQRWCGGRDAARVRLAVFGGRELAAARILLHLPHRFYVPAGTSAEHRLVWPRLTEVEALPGRAVHVCPEHPEPGLPAQLAFPPAPPG